MADRNWTKEYRKGEGWNSSMMPPKRVLMQQHHKEGSRRAKLPEIKWEKPKPKQFFAANRSAFVRDIKPWVNHAGQAVFGDERTTVKRPRVKDEQISGGNLIWQDYRFFTGAKEPSSQYSRCRACRMILCGQAERVEHLKQFKCTLWLAESYKVLNLLPNALVSIGAISKRECVSCGQVTTHSLWGLPICDKPKHCIENWMFDEDMLCANLTAALVKVYEVLKGTLEGAHKQYEQNKS